MCITSQPTPDVPRAAAMGQYQRLLRRRLSLLAVLLAAIVACVLVDFTLGPSGLGLEALLHTLFHPQLADAGTRVIVWDIRLPYALMAVAVGLSLGLAGAEMQTILNNPLASPFTLGVSSAAAFGAALAIILRIGVPGLPETWFIAINAFIFALLLDAVTRWTRVATSGVVLFGIALVFTFNALVSMMQFIATEDTLQGLVFWTMGSLARASWPKLTIMSVAFALMLPWSMFSAWKLTALRLGDKLRYRRQTVAPGHAAAYQYSVGAGGRLRRADRFHRSGGAPHRPADGRRRSPLLSARQRAAWRAGLVDGVGGI